MITTPTSLQHAVGEARPIVERIVWCTVATAGPEGPRARLMHPVWFWDDEQPWALVTARPTPTKLRHLDHRPLVSCSYWDPAHETAVIDATAEWVPAQERADAWARVRAVPEPVGFDPAMIWPDGPASDDCRFLCLQARRIVVTTSADGALRWTAGRAATAS